MTRALRCEQQSGRLEPIRWWAYPILLAGVALAFDAADRRVPFDVLISGLLDEPAHLATAALGLLVLACFIDVPRRFYVAALNCVRGHRPGSHTARPRAAWKPGSAPGHALACHRDRLRCRSACQSSTSSRAGRSLDRLGAPFRAGHRRGSAGRADALATSGHGVDGQLPVVPGNDHHIHSCSADSPERRHPPHSCPPAFDAYLGQGLLSDGSCDLRAIAIRNFRVGRRI